MFNSPSRLLVHVDCYAPKNLNRKTNVSISGFNDNEICDFVEMTRDKPIDIRFIEYMPFSGNKWETQKMVSFRLVLDFESEFAKTSTS